MNEIELKTLHRLLMDWADEDFDLPGYSKGEWSRSNLESLTDDIETRLKQILVA